MKFQMSRRLSKPKTSPGKAAMSSLDNFLLTGLERAASYHLFKSAATDSSMTMSCE